MANTVHRQVDHDPHGEHAAGGHEIDSMPNKRLFNLLFGLSVLVLASCIAVIQLFNRQVSGVEAARIQEGFYDRRVYDQEMRQVLEGSGVVTVREDTGQETQRYYLPLADTLKKVVEDPSQLKARPKYAGWERSDTFKAIEQIESKAAVGLEPGANPTPAQPTVTAPGEAGAAEQPVPTGTDAAADKEKGGAIADDQGASPSGGGQLPKPQGTASTGSAAPAQVPPTQGAQPQPPQGDIEKPSKQAPSKPAKPEMQGPNTTQER